VTDYSKVEQVIDKINFVLTGLYCPYCGKNTLYQTDAMISRNGAIYICSLCESSYYISGMYDDMIGDVRRQMRKRKTIKNE